MNSDQDANQLLFTNHEYNYIVSEKAVCWIENSGYG